jgi:UDP-N-acetylglucosamine:LPS N-acetylglucosamine transferase
MTATQNVLILTSDTGGGHRSAAQAIEDSLKNASPDRVFVEITQVLEEATVASRWMADFYNYLLREHQDWMKYYYWTINKIRPNESKLIFKSALGYGMRVFERVCPNVIVSVHPMTQHFFAYILRKLRLLHKIPLITVVTDPCYGFWQGWACEDVKEYYVATDDAKQQLLDYGIPSFKIHNVGMPVHRRFQPAPAEERYLLREQLGLDPDRFTVFINAGWAGGGNIPKIYQELVKANLDIQAVFLTGRNEKLFDEGHQLAQAAAFPVKVMGYTQEIEKVMNASNIMVSKLGGLTTFEALATELPIIADVVTLPMPQEEQTGMYIEKTGTGILLNHPERIVSVVQSLLSHPEQYQAMRAATQIHGRPGAVEHIAQRILGTVREPVHLL